MLCTSLMIRVALRGNRDHIRSLLIFFFTDPAPTEIYTLSLHDALPIFINECQSCHQKNRVAYARLEEPTRCGRMRPGSSDRKSTRLNSSHVEISYAVFCLKKKNVSSFGHGALAVTRVRSRLSHLGRTAT